jgi:hypothetical protein
MLALDHGLIFVTDLADAAAAYQRLGFILTPRGSHPALGTANHTIMFEHDYLELITVLTRGPLNERWAAILDRGDGLGAMALATPDARATRAELRGRGIEVSEVVDFARPVATGGGVRDARFSVAHLPPDASPALPAFFCQHHTRELVWLPAFQQQPNGVRAVAGLVVAHRDPARLAAAYRRLLSSEAVRAHPGGIEVDLGGARLLVVEPAFVAARLGQRFTFASDDARPIGVSLITRDLGSARRLLAANAVPFAPFGPRSILAGPPFTHGVYLEFLAAG